MVLMLALTLLVGIGLGWHLREAAYARQAVLWDTAVRDGTRRTYARGMTDGRNANNLPPDRYTDGGGDAR